MNKTSTGTERPKKKLLKCISHGLDATGSGTDRMGGGPWRFSTPVARQSATATPTAPMGVFLTYPLLGRRSNTWTARGLEAAVAISLSLLWQWHKDASDQCPYSRGGLRRGEGNANDKPNPNPSPTPTQPQPQP